MARFKRSFDKPPTSSPAEARKQVMKTRSRKEVAVLLEGVAITQELLGLIVAKQIQRKQIKTRWPEIQERLTSAKGLVNEAHSLLSSLVPKEVVDLLAEVERQAKNWEQVESAFAAQVFLELVPLASRLSKRIRWQDGRSTKRAAARRLENALVDLAKPQVNADRKPKLMVLAPKVLQCIAELMGFGEVTEHELAMLEVLHDKTLATEDDKTYRTQANRLLHQKAEPKRVKELTVQELVGHVFEDGKLRPATPEEVEEYSPR